MKEYTPLEAWDRTMRRFNWVADKGQGMSWLLLCIVVLCPTLVLSQDLSPAEFDVTLKACAQSQNIPLSAALEKEIDDLYSDQNSKGSLTNVGTFLLKLPESDQAYGYKLYTACIAQFLKPTIVQGPTTPPTTAITVYKVCSGEYERACPPHDAYLYCYSDLKAWAAAHCTSFTTSRVTTYGGNKCGYSLDAIVCSGPK
jgi:hypothetical protein